MKFLIIIALVACVAADASHITEISDTESKILRQDFSGYLDGQFVIPYDARNEISAQETGALNNPKSEYTQSQATWLEPNGEVVELHNTVDKNGNRVQDLPLPEPNPEEFLKTLENIKPRSPAPEKN